MSSPTYWVCAYDQPLEEGAADSPEEAARNYIESVPPWLEEDMEEDGITSTTVDVEVYEHPTWCSGEDGEDGACGGCGEFCREGGRALVAWERRWSFGGDVTWAGGDPVWTPEATC